MSGTFVITAKAENVLRVLQKLASLMTRKRLKFQEMQITETGFTLTLQADAGCVQWLVKQMKKCVDVFDLDLKLPSIKVVQLSEIKEQKHAAWKELCLHMGRCGLIF